MKYLLYTIISLVLFSVTAYAQTEEDKSLIQFSGMILDGSNQQLYPVPYTNVLVRDKSRGTYSDLKGFFTIVVEKGDVIVFSAIGYKSVEISIPDSLTESRYSIVQLMTQDTFNLPETIVFPWPSREHFRQEFLAMDVTSEMENLAVRNLAQEVLDRSRKSVAYDGKETASIYMRQQAQSYYYIGQAPPMNIFNPVAWQKFFKAWKDGDYKKKKKKN